MQQTASQPTTSRRRFLQQVGVAGAATTLVWHFPGVADASADRVFSGSETIRGGFTVPAGQVWAFNPNRSTTVTVAANVVVKGVLRMRPAKAGVVHTLRFVDVKESRFVGGGMNVMASDVGLWVRGGGRLDMQGTPKEAWTTTGWHRSWKDADEVRIAPTRAGDHGAGGLARFRRGDAVPAVRVPGGAAGASFTDTAGHTFQADIEAVAAAGIVNGRKDGSFAPNADVTRAQAAVMIGNAMKVRPAGSAGFRDTRGHWAEREIDAVVGAGIMRGRSSRRFSPDDNLTRAQAAVVISQALRLRDGRAPRYSDIGGHWARREIQRVAAAGIMGRTSDGRFRPDRNITRGQLAATLRRAFKLPASSIVSPVGRAVFPAETMNLTRNVRIMGTATGRVHINITSSAKQTLRYVELRHMGPRQPTGEKDFTAAVLGRYALHFHHCMDASRGSLIEGVVAAEVGGHSFVAHNSHGVTFRKCIAYDVFDDAYWWDPGSATNDALYDRCVAAYVRSDPRFRGYGMGGFFLGEGVGNKAVGCVATAVQGNKNSAGFVWPSKSQGLWQFRDSVAHNNKVNGIFVWQNSWFAHVIDRFTGFRNGKYGVEHGAYTNHYQYDRVLLFDNGEGAFLLHAVSRSKKPIVIRRSMFHGQNAIRTTSHRLAPERPTLVESCQFLGHGRRAVVIANRGSQPDIITFKGCNITRRDVAVVSDHPKTQLRFV